MGTSRTSASVTWASRSARASLVASMPRWIHRGSAQPLAPQASAHRRLEGLEQVQQLQGDDTAAVRRVRGHAGPAIGGRDRGRPVGAMVGEAAGRERRTRTGEECRLACAEIAVVEGVGTLRGDAFERARQCRQSDDLARRPRSTVRAPVVEAGGPRFVAEAGGGDLHRAPKRIPGREAVRRQLDRRREHAAEWQATPPAMGVAPRAYGSRHRHPQRTAERQTRQTRSTHRFRAGPGRCAAGPLSPPTALRRLGPTRARTRRRRCRSRWARRPRGAALVAIAASTAWPPAARMLSPAPVAR